MATLDEKLARIRSAPRLENQQQTNVVLSAIEDTLKDQRTEPTGAAYFSALLALLRHHVGPTGTTVNEEVASAIVYLLDLVTPEVSDALLRSKFTEILSILAPALVHPASKAPFMRAVIGCLEHILAVQGTSAWEQAADTVSARKAMADLLTVALDHRPKVRKRAQEAIAKILSTPMSTPALDHPAAEMCAVAALQGLSTDSEASLMHSLHLIKAIALAGRGWHAAQLEPLCESILKVTAHSTSAHSVIAAFDVLDALLNGISGIESSKLGVLLSSIMKLQPSRDGVVPAWLAAVARAHAVAASLEPEATYSSLPTVFVAVVSHIESENEAVRSAVAECVADLLPACVPAGAIVAPSEEQREIAERIGRTANGLLGVQFQHAWREVFIVLGTIFDTWRWSTPGSMKAVIKAVGDVRSAAAFVDVRAADALLSQAVSALGPRAVLDVLPLNFDGGQGRAWMLGVLRSGVRNTELAHFKSELLPLSEKLFAQGTSLASAGASMQSKVLEAAVHQIWATLPGYCLLPTDVSEFDATFGEALGRVLYEQVPLRADIARAIRAIIESNRAVLAEKEEETVDVLLKNSRITRAQAEANIKHLSTLGPNILAILFNVYAETLPSSRGPLLQTVDSLLSIAPAEEISATFDRVVSMLGPAIEELPEKKTGSGAGRDTMPPTAHTLLDLLVAMSPYLATDALSSLFTASTTLLVHNDSSIQKKMYKVFPRLAERGILAARTQDLVQLLIATSEACAAPARRDRLLAISAVVPLLPAEDLSFVAAVLPEAVLATKEVNEKARSAAFDLVIKLAERMREGGVVKRSNLPIFKGSAEAPADAEASLDEFFTMLSAGLASNSHGVAATVNALARCLFEYSTEISVSCRTEVVDTVSLFLDSKNREIARAVLGFTKIVVLRLPDSFVRPKLATIVPGIVRWGKEHRERFKGKVKHLLERMLKRFGDDVERACPEEDRKLVANIRKTRERQARKEAGGADDKVGAEGGEDGPAGQKQFASEFDRVLYGSDSESDGDDDEPASARAKGGKGKKGTHILESAGEPLDLLSRDAISKISSRTPLAAQAAVRAKRKVALNEDGKLLVNDENDDDDDDDDVDIADDADISAGIDAYVSAIRGANAGYRGSKDRLKFRSGQTRANREREREEDDADADADAGRQGRAKAGGAGRGGGRGGAGGRGGRGGGSRGRGGPRGRGDRGARSRGGRGRTRGGKVVKA